MNRYYQLVLIWMKDAGRFGAFLDGATPIAGRHGHGLERMLHPDAIYADSMPRPHIVNVVYYGDKDAFAAFERDLQPIVHLRTESIDLATVAGIPFGEPATEDGATERLYVVEVARFGPRGAAGYRAYEAEADPVMARYGYRVERIIRPESASGFAFAPDLVKIAYFDCADGMDRFHHDPAHARLERELYPAAVQQSVWITGRVHPSAADFRSVAK